MIRATFKSLFAHKLRFVLTGIAVVLGVAFMAGTFVITDTVGKVFDDLFAGINENTDAFVRSAESTEDFGMEFRPRIPESVAPIVADVDGVELAEPNFFADQGFRVLDRDGEPLGMSGFGAPTLAFAWEEVNGGHGIVIEDGRPPEEPNEIAVNASTARDGGYEVGDEVRVTSPFGDPETPYVLVGLMRYGNADSPGGAITMAFELAEMQRIAGALPPLAPEPELTGVVVSGEDDVSQQELVDRIRLALDDAGVEGLEVVTGETIIKENQDSIAEGVGFFTIVLSVAGAIALLVGAFIIYNTFSIVVAQRTRELALLRALGASGRQIRIAVLGEAFAVALGAAIIGAVAGVGLGILLQGALRSIGLDIPNAAIIVRPMGIAIAMTVGIVITVVSAIVPAVKASRVPPLAAIREVAVEDSRLGRRTAIGVIGLVIGLGLLNLGLGLVGDVANRIVYVGVGALVVFLGVTIVSPAVARPIAGTIGWPVEKLRGVTGQLARANAVRNPRRSAATASALMVGVALVTMILVLAASIQRTVDVQVERTFTVDAIVGEQGMAGFGGTFSPDVARSIATLPEVQASTPVRFAGSVDFGDTSRFYLAADSSSMGDLLDLDVRAGALEDLDEDSIAVSERLANENGWSVGDTIAADFGIAQREMTIVAINGVGQREGVTDVVIGLGAFDSLGFPQGDQSVYIRFAEGIDPEDGMAAVEEAIAPYPVLAVIDQQGLKEQIAGQINQVIVFLFVLLALAIFIAFVGIVNTLALSVFERVREIGLLRAVGMSRRQLRSAIRWEAVLVSLFGAVLGLIVGIGFGWAVVRALESEGIEEFSAAPIPLVIVTICAAIFGVLAAIWPARRAARMNVLEAVSTDE